MLKFNKKAQLGETMTWFIATIVIIGILIIFTFVSSLFAESKGAIVDLKRVFSGADFTEGDFIKTKTILAFNFNTNDADKINNWIMEAKQNE